MRSKKTKLQYFGHLVQISDSLEKTHWKRLILNWEKLKAGGEGGERG